MSQTVQKYDPIFLEAVARVLATEGGYLCNPSDPGGETNFGIAKRSYADVEAENLTRDQAVDIYWNDSWPKFSFYRLRGDIAIKAFDLAVVTGAPHAMRCLQHFAASLRRRRDRRRRPRQPDNRAAYSWPNANALCP